MGTTPSGILAYGYALGNTEEGWDVREAQGESDLWVPHWIEQEPEDMDDADRLDQIDQLEWQLIKDTGLVDREYPPTGASEEEWATHRDLRKQAKKQVGVELIFHGYDSSLQYALAAFHVEAEWGSVEVIDFATLSARRTAERWDEKLQHACQVLRITPVVAKSEHYDYRDYEPARLREPIQPNFLLLARYF